MKLENKEIGILFMDSNLYIKENLLFELYKISKCKNINIIPIVEGNNINYKNKALNHNFRNIKLITTNDIILLNKNSNIIIKKLDFLIIIGFEMELFNNLEQNNFDQPIIELMKSCEEENIPIIIGIKTKVNLFIIFEHIKKFYNQKKYYFIPILFPNIITNPNLISFDSSKILKTVELANNKIQIEPIISCNYI